MKMMINQFLEKFILPILIVALIILIGIGIISKDPQTIIFSVILGIIILLIIIASIFDKFNPKNKISDKLDKILVWIRDSIQL